MHRKTWSLYTAVAGAALGALLIGQTATAAPVWQVFGTTVAPSNLAKYVAAFDTLMSSAIAQQSPGRIILQSNVADGDAPATHSIVPVFGSAAERESFFLKLVASPEFAAFQAAVEPLAQPQSSTRYSVVKSWGDISDADIVWSTFSFDVSDQAAFLKAMETFLASPAGQTFPGQIYLSAVTFGGISPVTHVISVGYESEAEREVWGDSLQGNADFQAWIDSAQKVSENLGATTARTVKAWGNTLKDALTP